MVTFLDLKPGEHFKFKEHQSKEFVFGGLDGTYAKVFDNERDMKKFHNPAFVGAATRIRRIENE
jgi:hypothetical protein